MSPDMTATLQELTDEALERLELLNMGGVRRVPDEELRALEALADLVRRCAPRHQLSRVVPAKPVEAHEVVLDWQRILFPRRRAALAS